MTRVCLYTHNKVHINTDIDTCMLVYTFTYTIKNKVHINTNIDTCMLVRDIHKLMQSRTKFT